MTGARVARKKRKREILNAPTTPSRGSHRSALPTTAGRGVRSRRGGSGRCTGQPDGRPRPQAGGRARGFRAAGLRGALRGFRRGQRGATTIETAIAIVILVVGLAGLIEIVNASYTTDRMARAARAAARALALNGNADACAAIRREFRLDDEFNCGAKWTITVDQGVSATALPATLDAGATAGTGDMVLVRITWTRDLWSFIDAVPEVNAVEDDTESDDDEATPNPGLMTLVAIGLARSEPTS